MSGCFDNSPEDRLKESFVDEHNSHPFNPDDEHDCCVMQEVLEAEQSQKDENELVDKFHGQVKRIVIGMTNINRKGILHG